MDALLDDGDPVGLRDLIARLVQSAVLVERTPAVRSTRLRLHVTWQPDVQRLLQAGLLSLAAEPDGLKYEAEMLQLLRYAVRRAQTL